MYTMKIKTAEECAYDLVGLGEQMVRLEPMQRGHTVANALYFVPHIGGGELNSQVNGAILGLRTASVTSFPDHDLGRWAYNEMRKVGVDMRYSSLVPYDGIGRKGRMGLNFTTPGDGVRPNKVIYDRANSMASRMKKGDVLWKDIFAHGTRVFHTGGIFAALSETTPELMEEAMTAAADSGTFVTYDINIRKNLWSGLGGIEKAKEVNQRLACYANGIFGNEKDFVALGVDVKVPDNIRQFDITDTRAFEAFAKALMEKYPNLHLIGRSMRNEKTPTLVDWGGMVCARKDDGGLEFQIATPRYDLQLLERTGGGDTFYLGVIMGFMQGMPAKDAVELGAAASAYKMSCAGDTLEPGARLENIIAEVKAAQGVARATSR